MKKYGISTQVETAYTLTATVYDDNHTTNGMPQAVDAVAEFENASSEWAQGKNVSDYITITRTAENSFNVVCNQEFAEPILITVTAVNSDKSAVKRCDYLKRYSLGNIYYNSGNGLVVGNIEDGYTRHSDNNGRFSVGTLNGQVDFDSVTFYYEEAFLDAITNSSYYKYFLQQCEEIGIDVDLGLETFMELSYKNVQVNVMNGVDPIKFNLEYFLLSNLSVEDVGTLMLNTGLHYFRYAVIEAAARVKNAVRLEISWTYSYNGVIYMTGKANSGPPILFDTSLLGQLPAVGSVEWENENNDSIIF